MAGFTSVVGSAHIGDIATVFPGVPTFGRSVVGRGGARIKAVTVKDISSGGVDVEGVDELAVAHVSDVDRYLLQPGDVLLSVRGTQLKVAVAPDALAGAVATATLAVIRVLDGGMLPEVLATYLGSPTGQAQLNARARSATGQIALTARDIRDIEVPVPPMEAQQRIAELTREMDAYENAANEAIQQRREALAEVTATLMGMG